MLALLIGSSHRGEPAVHLMQRLLSSVDNNILRVACYGDRKSFGFFQNRSGKSGKD